MMINLRRLSRALEEERRASGFTQEEAAQRSGINAKTISSFETGHRVESMRLVQLDKLLNAYGTDLKTFVEMVETP